MTDEITPSNTNDSSLIEQYDEKINRVSTILLDLAEETEDEELREKLTNLSEQTSPVIKGVDIANDRIKIPMVLLRQLITPEENVPKETKAGQMYTNDGTHLGDSLTVIPVLLYKARRKWGEASKVPECQSLDNETGSRYGECAKCPYGQFEKNTRPECANGYSCFFLTGDLSNIYQVDLMRTSAPIGARIVKNAKAPALWARSFVLSSEKKQQTSGTKATYYTYQIRVDGDVDPEVMKVGDILYEYFYTNKLKAILLQKEYAKRNALSLTGMTNGAGADNGAPNTDAIDFSENM